MKINVIDFETYYDEKKPKVYCICYMIRNVKYYVYKDFEESLIVKMLDQLITFEKENEFTFFTHNINFDGYLIFEELSKSSIRFEWFIRDLNLYWIKIYYLKKTITIRCSYKLIPLSLKKLGEIVGVSKTVFPYKFINKNTLDYSGKIPNASYFESLGEYYEFCRTNSFFDTRNVTITYCLNDLEIIYKVLININKIITLYSKNALNFSFSFSSLSYYIFSKKFDKNLITYKKISDTTYNYLSSAYFGGRTEVFGNPIEGEIIHHFDFTGMYAQCMLKSFPVGDEKFETTNLDINKIGLHSVTVKSNLEIPVLPVHVNNKLMFPNGIFSGIYNKEILNLFIEKGGIILKHHSSLVYETEIEVFKDYVQNFINLRKKGGYYNLFGKIMNNGLYGSFALQEENVVNDVIFSEEEFHSLLKIVNVVSWKKINNVILVSIKKDHLSQALYQSTNKWNTGVKRRNIMYSIYISLYAQIKLYEGFEEVYKHKGRLYYCDTDSIFAGFESNYLNQNMGEIKWSDIYEDAVFVAPKFYQIKGEKAKIKGVRQADLDFNDLKNKFYNNEPYIIFKDQLHFSKNKHLLEQKYVNKVIQLNQYNKRIFAPSKKITFPTTIKDPFY